MIEQAPTLHLGNSNFTPNMTPTTTRHGWKFWAIFPGLCLASTLCALDSTILSTALPTITASLDSSSNYICIINAYTLTFTAIQPFCGQIADILGRKHATIIAICIFLLGSGICAGANETSMLIGGRAVQGLGGGGLSILPAMVVCDLVSLRERQKYTGLIYRPFAIGTFIEPNWRLNGRTYWMAMDVLAEFAHWRTGSTLCDLILLSITRPFWSYLVTIRKNRLHCYFLPVYFQAVMKDSPQKSGINTLAAAIPMVPFGIVGGILIAKAGHYKLNQILGFALAAIAIGCFSILDQDSSTAVWVILQIIFAAGAGIVLTATLPAIQAPLPESDVATATATWGFIQSLGFVCGVAIPSSIFEAEFRSMVHSIDDRALQEVLRVGGAYEHASRAFIISLPEESQVQVVRLFVASLKLVWEVGSAFAIFGFLVSFFVQDIELRSNLETEFGYKEETEATKVEQTLIGSPISVIR
ncbi:major facilitator transporter [Sclerotinia borealis F-4128]|uniref:Major facilitator transporter n=1 Tax=Sclerotinia borealis (strain F-4128) TaxID=1432307 RepID=W9CTD3_SCLBF|nr:major facilitator transporter [Sclerotinia borealis F-4128]